MFLRYQLVLSRPHNKGHVSLEAMHTFGVGG
jgi:hypothetical protein